MDLDDDFDPMEPLLHAAAGPITIRGDVIRWLEESSSWPDLMDGAENVVPEAPSGRSHHDNVFDLDTYRRRRPS